MKKRKASHEKRASQLIQTWVSDEELAFVQAQAKAKGLSVYAYLRELVRSEIWITQVMREEVAV